MADFQDFCRIFRRTLFVSVLCFAFGFMSARAEEYTIAYLNQYGDEISDLTPDRYTEKELPLARENLPNGEAVSIATGCELVDELWYWDDKMSELVESIEPEPLEDKVLYGNLRCDENRIVTLNPAGKEEIGSKGTEQLYYYRNLGDYGEFFYNEYNGSKSASGVASTIILPTYDTEKYTFLGYYADPGDMGTQCVDEKGYITEYGFQQMAEGGEGETSWDAVYDTKSVPMNTIQLLPMYDITDATTSPGTGYIYGKPSVYGGGVYDAYYGGNQISSITIPTWRGHSFLGYYSSTSSTSTQYINSVGNITAAGIAKAQEYPGSSNQTWYGHWSGTYNLHYKCSTTYNVTGQEGDGNAPADESHSAGQSVTLQRNQGCYPTYSYYYFGGWNCFNRIPSYYSGGQVTDYNSGPINNGYSLTMPYNDVWCEPNWIPDNVTLSYNCGWLPNTNTPVSGSAPSSVSGSAPLLGVNLASAADAQNTCTIDTNTYSFVGWYCPGGPVWISEPGDAFGSITEDVTCYAVWAENNPCAPGSEASNSPEILGGTISDWNQISSVNVSLSDLSGMCSETVGSYPGQIGTPSSTSGDYCWCQATSYNSTPLNNYPWVFVQYYDGCNVADCQSWCSSSVNLKDPDYFFNVSLLSNPICEYTLDYNCGTVGGTAPSSVSGIIPTNITQNSPMSLASTAPDCNNGNNILSGWTCYASSDTGYTTPLTSASYSLDTMPYDNVNCTAQWTQPSYTVTYNCNNSQVQQTYVDNNNGNGYFYGDTASLWQQSGNTVGSCQIPEHKLFAGWDCYDVNGYLPSGDGLGSIFNYTYVTFETLDDVLADDVICEAVWVCDTANGYTLYNGVCINEYSIRYRPGSHGVFDSGYGPNLISFGPGANLGGGTWGQPWSTQTQGNTHIVANDNCYEFCGWSESQSDVCGSGSILSAGTQQGNYNHIGAFGEPDHLDLYAIWGCASSCVQSGNQCVPAPTTYTVTYHGGSCNTSASTFNETVNAGTSYTVENPECASSNSNDWLPTDGCSNFIGWSDSPYDSTQTASSQVVYGTCDACATQTGSCGTISNISSNIDLYAICDVMAHNVIYHNCDGDEVYTHSNAISLSDGAQSVDYTPLSPSDSQLSSLITPLSSFQGWATSETAGDDESWCGLEPGDLYQELYGGNSDNDYYKYTKTGEICTDVDLYAVCCPLNLNWDVNGGSWPTGSSGNQTTCEYGAIAGSAGSIGYGQTPLQTPLRTGYTFTGWKVTNYSTP